MGLVLWILLIIPGILSNGRLLYPLGNYELSFRYGLGNVARPLQLKVNGTVVVASLPFPSTTLWSNWQNVISTQPLNAGINEIQLTSIGSNGGNIDKLQVTNAPTLGTNQVKDIQKKNSPYLPQSIQTR
jgi:hypothetical protein